MIRWMQFLRLIYATVDESQPAMSAKLIMRFFGFPTRLVIAATVLAGFCGDVAAQQAAPASLAARPAASLAASPAASPAKNAEKEPDPPAPNPFRAVTDFMGLTTEHREAADFVRATRPDEEKMGYSHMTGVDKKRVPVKTAAEVEADKAALIDIRGKADARRKHLEGERLAPIAPNKAPPPLKDNF